MFGIGRRGVAVVVPAVAALVLTLAPRQTFAGELDDAVRKVDPKTSLFGFEGSPVAAASAQPESSARETAELEKIWLADFHPETDRWTERNNRIKISLIGSGMFFAQNLRITHNCAGGVRISWEVPGFIGVRLEEQMIGWARMEVREGPGGISGNHNKRHMDGIVNYNSLSVAIFNPELSYPANLVMWAGFGVDLWYYNFADRDIRRPGPGGTFDNEQYTFYDWNVGGNAFFDLEYKITDIFHVGIEIREHVLYAPQTERGEFYKINGHTQGKPHNRNQDFIVALSAVHEVQLTISVLF
ncbi:hypothetical protein HY251_12450 [bacterium]|nr:hypothetical protein [bacterium]